MNRFTQRVEHDLNQIADRATPSSTAWEAIQQRIDEQDTNSESTMEVIMLSPDQSAPRIRSLTWMLAAASVAAVALVGGLIVAANRGTDDNVRADQPDVTVPDGAEDENAPAPDGEQSDAQDTAVDLPTQGTLSARCSTTSFDDDGNGTLTGPQTCVIEGDPLPVAAETRNDLTIFVSGEDAPDLFVSSGDSGFFNAGYTLPGGSVRYSGFEPGIDDFVGETIYTLGRRPVGGEAIPGISDWTIEPDDAPLPTTEEGGVNAEITMTCSAEYIEGDDTSQVLELACTYAGNDARFIPEPEVITAQLFAADPDATRLVPGTPAFIIGTSDSGSVMAGITTGVDSIVRAVGVRPGTGEFDGMLIHDVLHLIVDDAFNITGTVRSTVYPDE